MSVGKPLVVVGDVLPGRSGDRHHRNHRGGMETPFVLERFPDADVPMLQSPDIVADTVLYALSVPAGGAVSELVVVPRRERSWP
ncbi:hypothetical protein [Streptomyces enissocaesilis]|uniref:Uncharacterized protein n=1 Tax=Streptomyces enissocaesilis TaxID=332589 RepID=A0ABN3X9P7_9ACTN